jgi:alkaline phosphatase
MKFLSRRAGRAAIAVAATGGLMFCAGVSYAGYSSENLSVKGGANRVQGDRSEIVKRAVDKGRAQNVILLIGDGMGDSEITSARNYAYGAAGSFPGIDALPLTGQYTTYSLTKEGRPDYVPDSAATGSAWATGTKTYDNAISVDIRGKAQPTLLELAKAKGLKTGDVTTSEIQDATPAVQVAHISARSCYGPVATAKTCPEAAKENGGRGSITEQLLDTRPDVTLGGGAKTFGEKAVAGRYAGQTLLDQAKARGYQVVDDKTELSAVRTANQTTPVLGLFGAGNLPVRYVGPKATPTGGTTPAARCTPNPERPASQPRLATMTRKAIDLLENDKGFFLQVEGASIDKQDHAANACGQIGETIDLDEAVQVALAYAKRDGNTSVFVTADHGHTSQIVEAGENTPGLTTTLLTHDNAPMTISYGTAEAGGSQQHTGTQVRLAGYGPKAANVVGLTDQTDLHTTIASALKLPSRLPRR